MSNKLRDEILNKYGVGGSKPLPVSSDNKAIEPTPASPANPTGAPEPAKAPGSLRDEILSKYLDKKVDPKTKQVTYSSRAPEPTPQEQQPAPTPTPEIIPKTQKPAPVIDPKTGKDLSGIIASPEYFASKLDIVNKNGRFVKTVDGPDAYEQAQKEAADIGGAVTMHVKGGFIGRAAKKIKDTVVSAFNDVGNKGADFLSSLDSENPGGALDRTTKATRLGVSTIGAVFSPVSGAFSGAEEVPVVKYPAIALNYIFGKAGQAGGWVGGKVVDELPVSDQAKEQLRPAVEELSALLAQIALGKASAKATAKLKTKTADLRTEIKTKITKDVIETQNLPRTVYVEPAKIKDIFQTGKKISAEELDLVKSLGLDAARYKDAIKNGVTIDIPAETVVTIADKPYWKKVKDIFGVDSTPEVRTSGGGRPSAINGALLEDVSQRPINAPRIVDYTEQSKVPSSTKTTQKTQIQPVSEPVKTALESPVSPKLIETIKAFTPEEASAFGRRIIERINEEVGTKITEAQGDAAGIPQNIKVNEIGSPDGRPAQFTNGKIELFLPDLKRDLQALAQGKRILAHGGANAKVYELKKGESMEDLAIRYTKDVLVHELSHQKTVNIADDTKMKQLRNDVIQARASGNKRVLNEAQMAVQKFMEGLETKALEYERANRSVLEAELFGKGGRKTPIQSQIDKTVTGGASEKKTIPEKKLLRDKLKGQERVSKEAYKAGKKEGSNIADRQTRNAFANKEEKIKRQGELDKLKQRITDRNKSEAQVEQLKNNFKYTTEKILDRQATLQQKRQALVEYAEAFLPYRERGKFLRAIRYPGSDKEFLSVLARMQKAADLVDRQALVSEIRKEIADTKVKTKDGKPNPKFEYAVQKKLNRIRALQKGFEEKAKEIRASGNKKASAYELAQNEIADKISNFQTANPDALLPDEILSEIQDLRMVGLKDMTAAELRSVLSDIQSIKETGRTLKELERFNRESEIQRIRDGVEQVLTGGQKNPKAKVGLRRPEDKPTSFEKVGDFFTLKHAGFEEILDALSKFDKGSKPYESFMSEHFSTKVRDSFVKQNQGELDMIKKVSDGIKENYGFKSDKEMEKYLNTLKEKINLENVTMADGSIKEITITKGEAMKMYEWAQDPTLAETFTEGLNWGPEAQKKVFDLLSDADKKMVEKNLEFYQEYYKGINDVYVKEFGVDLPFNENYSPVSRNVETTIPENVLLAQEMKAYASAKNNSLKTRVRNNIDLKPKDIFSVLVSHINQMEHYKAWSDTMFEMRRVFGDKEVRRIVDDYHGRKYLREVDSFLNDFARDGVDRAKTVEWLDKLRVNTTTALLGLNWKQFPKQLTGVSNYWIEIPTDAFFAGVTSFWTSPMAKAKFLFENSEIFRERFGEGYERDIKRALQTNEVKTLAGAKNRLREKMFVFLRQADKLTVYQGGWAAYRYKLAELAKAGMSEAEAKQKAIKYAEDVTNRVQESSQFDTLSSIQRGGSLYKALTMFGGQPSKYVRLMWNIARNWKYGRGSKAVHVKRFLVLWIVVPTIYNAVSELLKDKENRDTPGQFAGKVALGPLTYPLIVGQIFSSLYDRVSGSRFNFNISPVLSIFDDAFSTIDQLSAGDVTEALTYLADIAGKTTGVPTPVFTRPARKALKNRSDSPEGAAAQF